VGFYTALKGTNNREAFMIDYLLSASTLVGSVVSMVLATVAGLLVYGISYKFISKYETGELKDPTSNLFRVVGMLVALMLSLAFAEVIVELRAIENAIEREAVAISDTFDDLQRFDIERTREIRTILVDYTQAIIEDDWPALANDRLGQKAGALNKQLSDRVMELEPATEVQKHLWSRILADLDAASDYRLIRLDNALAKPPVYIYVIFFGFLVTMACFGAYRPQVPLVALISLYTVFVGLVLYLVLALSDPFHGGIGVDPTTFEYLVETLRAENE
jgi:ABC-type multidrug transport system fused ATPase/permease subunit